jgi:hypothetical protein
MAHLFVSYSRRDSAIVDRLVGDLATAGIRAWIDRGGIVGGATWTNTLVDAIRDAMAVLVAVSPDAVDSIDVGKEIAVAVDAKRPLLPVTLRPTKDMKGLAYHLAHLQKIDLVSDFDAGFASLLRSIDHVRRGSGPAATAAPLSEADRQFLDQLKLQTDIDRQRAQLMDELARLEKQAREKAAEWKRPALGFTGDAERRANDAAQAAAREQLEALTNARDAIQAKLAASVRGPGASAGNIFGDNALSLDKLLRP